MIKQAIKFVAALFGGMLSCDKIPIFAFHLLLFTAVTGFFFAALNGIPMKMNGATNDGYNIMLSRRNMLSRKLFANQLRINAMIQDGTRPRHAAYTARWRPAEADT